LTEAEKPAAQNRWVAPNYFRTMSIPIIRGRDFNELDTARSQFVTVIDEALAQRQFSGDNPIGQHLLVSDSGPTVRNVEIVGVVGNVKHFSLDDPPTMTYYSPITQVAEPALGFLINNMNLIARTESNVVSAADTIRTQIQSLDPDIAASSVQTMDQLLASSTAPRRFNLVLIEIFAVAALVLSALGVYSLVAYTVNQRKRDIGIRIALGASARAIFTEVLRDGLILVLMGAAAGVVAALLVTRMISGMLYGVTAKDPLTFAVTGLVLIFTALAACYIPAYRATRVPPMVALRPD
jgi:putative ABC transport system permease protein